MSKQQARQWAQTESNLIALGFSIDEVEQLRRIQMTLHRWHERECNGEIDVDGETGIAYAVSPRDGCRRYKIANRYAGALKRLAMIMKNKAGVQPYIQGDPRGCALYIVRDSDVPTGANIDSYYSCGIAVCI